MTTLPDYLRAHHRVIDERGADGEIAVYRVTKDIEGKFPEVKGRGLILLDEDDTYTTELESQVQFAPGALSREVDQMRRNA